MIFLKIHWNNRKGVVYIRIPDVGNKQEQGSNRMNHHDPNNRIHKRIEQQYIGRQSASRHTGIIHDNQSGSSEFVVGDSSTVSYICKLFFMHRISIGNSHKRRGFFTLGKQRYRRISEYQCM